MTAHLNQDYLENSFSQIRGISGFKLNPTALEFKYRIRKYESLLIIAALNIPQDLPILDVKNPFNEVAHKQLEDMDWESEVKDICIDNVTFIDRADEGGAEYVSGYLAKVFLQDYPEMSKVGSDKECLPFWVNFFIKLWPC